MAARRPAGRRRRHAGDRAGEALPPGLRWSCAVIFLVGLVLLAVGAWGLLRGGSHGAAVLGLGTSIVLGALLVVFAALLPWLGDGPVRIGPLAMTLRIRERRGRPGRRVGQRPGRRPGRRRRAAAPRVNGEQ